MAGGINPYVYVENDSINWIDPWGLSKWYPVPGHKGWDVRRDQPHHSKDYPHDHYRHKGKDIPRKVNPESGEQKSHGKGKCDGEDKDVPQDVIDSANQAFSFTGNIGIDLLILETLEDTNDFLDSIDPYIPSPPPIFIPGAGGAPIPILVP